MSEEHLLYAPASSIEGPALAEAIRNHLGQHLQEVYAAIAPEPNPGIAALVARLDAVLAAAATREEAAFRAGLLEAAPSLHAFARSLARDPAAAEDLVQDTMLRAWRSRTSFALGTNLGAWLFTIMRNTFYSVHRKRGREVQDIDGEFSSRLASVPEQGGHLDLQDVRAAMDRLQPVMRDTLVLVAIENVSYEEAAERLGCQVGTVKSRVWRAREQLARMLGYTGAEVGADHVTLSAMGTTAAGRAMT